MLLDSRHTTAALAVAASGVLVCGVAPGQDSAEPTYGRVSGDISLVAGAGGTIGPRGARAEGELRVRYLDAAGVFATYEDAVLASASSQPGRVISGGVELRPLFLYRWLRGLETQRGQLDLAIDSVGLELGAFLSTPSTDSADFWAGLQLGLGIEVPLEPRATGVWVGLHGGVRWDDQALATATVGGPMDRAAYLTMTLAWHHVVTTHIVDLSDQGPSEQRSQ
jgi:hypothetical protein